MSCLSILKGHSSRVNCVRILKSGEENFILSGGMDAAIRLWKNGSGAVFEKGQHTARVNDIALLGPQIFASVSDDKIAKVWDVETMTCISGEEWRLSLFML